MGTAGCLQRLITYWFGSGWFDLPIISHGFSFRNGYIVTACGEYCGAIAGKSKVKVVP